MTPSKFREDFDTGKTRMIGLVYDEKTEIIMLSRFNPIPERNRRTDRFAVSISRVSMLTRDKMNSDSIPSN